MSSMGKHDGLSKRMGSFGISKRNPGAGGDDHFLMEEGHPPSFAFPPQLKAGLGGGANVLPPAWVDDVDAVHRAAEDVRRLTSELSSMHAARIGTVFGRDLDEMEKKIERKTREITDLFRKAEQHLQRVGVSTRRAGGEEATVGANVQRSLAKQLQELSVAFRLRQRKYLEDVKAQKSGGLVETETRFGINLEDDGNNGDFGGFSISGPGAGGVTTQQLSVVDDLQDEIQSRDVEISQIAKSIEELGSIFKELAVLVIDQGTILDRIDYNMEAVVEHTQTGIVQLEKAEKTQKSARPMKCIIILLITIAVLLLILLLKKHLL